MPFFNKSAIASRTQAQSRSQSGSSGLAEALSEYRLQLFWYYLQSQIIAATIARI